MPARPRVYGIRIAFRAPLPFVYRWCTDYRPFDGRLAGDPYDRRILSRSRRRVVLEDLWWEPGGWGWRHTDVSLRPLQGWHADSVGNVRTALIDYRLRALPGDRTELEIRMRRWPTALHPKQPVKRVFEDYLRSMWGNLGRQLEREYRSRAGRSASAVRRRRRPSS